MGMTIDEVVKELKWTLKVHESILASDVKELDIDCNWVKHWECVVEALKIAINTMNTYDRLRTDYEHRLKADLAAMLTEIQMEIEEKRVLNDGGYNYNTGYTNAIRDCEQTIQQKINALKDVSTTCMTCRYHKSENDVCEVCQNCDGHSLWTKNQCFERRYRWQRQ